MKKVNSVLIIITLLLSACNEVPTENLKKEVITPSFEDEKTAILNTLNNETRAAFARDYEGWQSKWIHGDFVTKTYLEIPDSTFAETLGWEEIDDFVKTFFKNHPEPEPVPELLSEIDMRLYGEGAWVTYEQQDSLRGLKRETRLMEKVDGEWKIAGMQTTIYGFENKKD